MIPEQPLLTKVKSQVDGKRYFVSTCKNNVGAWETAVIERGFFGKPKLNTPVRVVNSWTFEDAHGAHITSAEAATTQPRASWENTTNKILFATTLTAPDHDWLREAMRLEKRKKWQLLVDHCRAWVRAEPNEPFAWHSLADAHIFAKQYPNAVLAYSHALTLKSSAVNWCGLANAYALSGEMDAAISAVRSQEEVMRSEPDDPLAKDVTAWVGLALTYHSLNQLEGMQRAFHEAEALIRNSHQEQVDDWFTIGLAYWNTHQPEKVAEVYQVLRQLDVSVEKRLRDATAH